MKNILTIIFLFICILAHAQDSKLNPKKMKGYSGETLTNAGHPIIQTQPSMNVYNDYGWLRGFSMVPSWGARIEEAWWFYDSKRMREEVALARKVHANCIRLWIDFTAWNADPENVQAGLEVKFFEKVVETIRSCRAKQPITIGLVTAEQIEGYAHFIDVLCAHPYAHDKEKLKEMILGFKKVQSKYHKLTTS